MTNLRTVAERAGVSLATASRVASGTASVRPETRRRVERAMRDLLYVPPGRQQTPEALGLLIPEFQNPVFAALGQAMETCATAAGFATILCNTRGSAAREVEYVHALLERRVQGMVFICSEITDLRSPHEHYTQLLERGARLVFVNGTTETLEVTSVSVDERAAGRIASEHLLELGHERVGFVAGSPYASPTAEKDAGRRDALRAAGRSEQADLIEHGEFTVEGGRVAGGALLRRPPGVRPTGVICSNDLMAIGVLHAAAELGLDVPGDVSVVGFDGIEASGWTQPPLTTVEQPLEEIAATAISAVLAQIAAERETHPSYVFRPRLRPGGTTAPPR